MNPSTSTPTASLQTAATNALASATAAATQGATACANAVTPMVNAAGDACTKSATQAKDYVRQHPTSSLLVAIGLSVAAVLVVRALTPPPPRNRAVRLLEDIQQRLADLTETSYDRASSLASDGAGVLGRGVDSLSDLHLDRRINKLSRWVKHFTH